MGGGADSPMSSAPANGSTQQTSEQSPATEDAPGESLAALLAALEADDQADGGNDPLSRLRSGTLTRPGAVSTTVQPASWAVTTPPPDWAAQFASLAASPTGLAYQFPYPLDAFQQQAVLHLEAGHDVFVAAHTSAGKTAAAVYAAALARSRATKCVYTSPIKTISNQKYRDFCATGFDTGLLTGDVAVNPQGGCLVMTTEVLQSMLYRRADGLRDLEFAVFDEVHYVNDADRGVVWEEALILLPRHVTLLCLSATVPNVADFADWVGRVRGKHVHVCGTTKRPVPLTHCVWFGHKLWPVCDASGWSVSGYRAMSAHAAAAKKPKTSASGPGAAAAASGGGRSGGAPGRGGGGRGGNAGGSGGGGASHRPPSGVGGAQGASALVERQMRAEGGGGSSSDAAALATQQLRPGEKSAWLGLLRHLQGESLLPCIVFCFSKRRCDALGDSLLPVLDLTTSAEKAHVQHFCASAFGRLSAGDAALPQLQRVRSLLMRGLGVHHAGLLPLLKEVVEVLFCDGTLKLLFATETFAMGVNAPARCCVFSALRKHDGNNFRDLAPGEYTQMAGRAGRRGVDTTGTVVLVPSLDSDQAPEEGPLRRLITGSGQPLRSQFRLTYGMILSVLRIEDLRVEDMLRASFAEWRAQRQAASRSGELKQIEKALARATAHAQTACAPVDPAAWAAADTNARLSARCAHLAERHDCAAAAIASRNGASALKPGRLVWVVTPQPLGVLVPALILRNLEATPSKGIVVCIFPWGGPPPRSSPSLPPAIAAVTEPGGAPPRVVAGRRKGDEEDDPWASIGAGGKKGGARGSSSAGSAVTAAPCVLPPGLPVVVPTSRGRAACVTWVPTSRVLGLCHAPPGGDAIITQAICDAVTDTRASVPLDTCCEFLATAQADPTAMLKPLDGVTHLSLGDPQLVSSYADLADAISAVASAWAPRPSGGSDGTGAVGPPPLSSHPEWVALACAQHRLAAVLHAGGGIARDAALERMPDYVARVQVLTQLGYLEPDVGTKQERGGTSLVVTLKGRAACEVATCDELLMTELLFDGLFSNIMAATTMLDDDGVPQQDSGLAPAVCAALLSAFVLQERSPGDDTAAERADITTLPMTLREQLDVIPPALGDACSAAWTAARRLGSMQAAAGVHFPPGVDGDNYASSVLKFGLVEAVYHWARGAPFSHIVTLTHISEGIIVRCVTRLHETCRELGACGRLLGDARLVELAGAAAAAVRRDIVFTSSLYVLAAAQQAHKQQQSTSAATMDDTEPHDESHLI